MNCEACGLPIQVCTALKMYRSAFRCYEEGDHAAAHKLADHAAAAIAEYKTEQTTTNKLYQLSDEDRLKLSGYF